TGSKISWISNSAADTASTAACAMNRKKHDVRVLGRLTCDSVDDLTLHSQRADSRDGEIDSTKHDAGLKIDGSGRLRVSGSWIVNWNVSFDCVLSIGWDLWRSRCRLWRPAALRAARVPSATTSATPTAIGDDVVNDAADTRPRDCQSIQQRPA